MKHLLKSSEKVWKHWKKEYLLELREFLRTYQISKGVKDVFRDGQIVIVHVEGQPRGLWRVGMIEGFIQGPDGKIQVLSKYAVQDWTRLCVEVTHRAPVST